MKLLDKLRHKNKGSKGSKDIGSINPQFGIRALLPQAPINGWDLTAKLSTAILERIFSFVCPHSQDESYRTCETSSPDEGCCLCDARDLAHCMRVNRRWRRLASNVLYNSVRIDIVHYCPREAILAESRKKGKFFDRNAEPEDVGSARLKLLTRTLRTDNPQLGQKVRYFKVPYMLRETNIAELAKAVSVMPKLQYVDLPDHFFSDHTSCKILRQELHARCPELKKMSYHAGSENALESLGRQNNWLRLEVLELEKLWVDPMVIRQAVAALPNLKALKITGIKNVDDSLFVDDPRLPPFPALEELILDGTPDVTAHGIVSYLSNEVVQSTINTLSFTSTGVLPSHLHLILNNAPNLIKLSVIETVAKPFGASQSPTASHFPTSTLIQDHNVPHLHSDSLEILNYEILGEDAAGHHPTKQTSIQHSYYAYLTNSLIAGGLPTLQELYVRDVNFPETLIDFTLPPAPFGRTEKRLSSNNPFNPANLPPKSRARPAPARPFNKELQVFTKGSDDMTWDFSRIEDSLAPPPGFGGGGGRGHSRNTSSVSVMSNRPMSSYGLSVGEGTGSWAGGMVSPAWNSSFRGSDVRRSVIATNGAGGFLSLPGSEIPVRPSTSGSGMARENDWPSFPQEEKRSSKYDMWR